MSDRLGQFEEVGGGDMMVDGFDVRFRQSVVVRETIQRCESNENGSDEKTGEQAKRSVEHSRRVLKL